MKIENARVALVGANGGIGRALARALTLRLAALTLCGRDAVQLRGLAADLRSLGGMASVATGDLLLDEGPERLAAALLLGGTPDALIYSAGQLGFGAFEEMTPEAIERLWRVNVTAPMRLVRALLPALREQGNARIVLVGSIFGSIGFPHYAAYSASKFALRGFAEALRRELAGSGVGVSYVAPRYTRTGFNEGAPSRIAERFKMAQDEPAQVATAIVDALQRDRDECYIGAAERWYVRINALFPRLLDGPLSRQAMEVRSLLVDMPPRARPEGAKVAGRCSESSPGEQVHHV